MLCSSTSPPSNHLASFVLTPDLPHFLAAFVVIVQRGNTPLHFAARYRDAACLKLLLEYKSDVAAATTEVCNEY